MSTSDREAEMQRALDALEQKVSDENLDRCIPARKKGERREDFVARCVDSEVLKSEFPDKATRVALCERRADRNPRGKNKA